MAKTLLFEAGFLALPVDLFAAQVPDFREQVADALNQEKLEFSRIRTWVNVNRLGILIEGLPDTQSDCLKEVRGPRASVAYDLNNLPTPAATGFASAQGLETKDLVIREVDGERFLFARKMTRGQPLEKCLQRLCNAVFSGFSFSVPNWSERSSFCQPLTSFCAMLNQQLLDLELDGVSARAEVINYRGLRRECVSISSAEDYPQIMKQLKLMNEFSEKRKNFEARIRSVLPESYLIRDVGGKVQQRCLFFENSQPLLVKFDRKYLEMPELIINKVVSGYFGYLICEDAVGKILPAAVAFPETVVAAPDEAQIRAGILNLQLEKVWQIWNRDVHSLPGRIEKIAEQLSENFPVRTELFCDCSLTGIALGLCEYLGCMEEQKQVGALLLMIEEGERTEIGKILQGSGFSVIFNRLRGVDTFKPYIEFLKEISMFFEDKIVAPTLKAAEIVCLAVLMQGYVNQARCFDCSPERIVNFLICSKLKLNLFAVFNQLFNGIRLDRKAWLEASIRTFNLEGEFAPSLEQMQSFSEFDPASFYLAQKEWKNHPSEDFEACVALLSRIKGKIAGIAGPVESEPETELEKALVSRLKVLESGSGVNYPEIFQFFLSEKVNIEACLMNLPAVLDDNSLEYRPRINLLQRLSRQLSRLPFVKKEKRSEKI